MRWNLAFAIAALGIFLGGCASKPQLPVPLAEQALTAQTGKVGIAMSAVPKVDTYFPGADCLLCYAFASASNSALTKHAATLANTELSNLGQDVAAVLAKKGVETVILAEALDLRNLPDASSTAPNAAKKDFSSLRAKHKIDKLLVLNVSMLGYWRTYASYVPTSDPKATVKGTGYLVDLKTNTYDWYLPIDILRTADGNWDEPPKYPGLTNAYFQALEAGRDSVLKTFDRPTP
jgi:hypothetical protein